MHCSLFGVIMSDSDSSRSDSTVVYFAGRFKSREEACVSIDDRGFLFGDGIYEVIRVVEGRLFRRNAHLARVDKGLQDLGIRLADRERIRIQDILDDLIRENRLESGQATLYLQITRGTSHPRKHFHPPPDTPPTILISATPFKPNYDLQKNGANAITVPDLRWARCDLKTVNLLPNTMAAQQAKERGAFGAIMVRNGVITEGSNNNVFVVMDGTLYTHPDSPHILSGITREVVFEIADEAGIPVEQEPVPEKVLPDVDEIIMTGTTTDIQPITRLNDRVIANGHPGTIVKLLQTGLKQKMGIR